MFRVVLVGVWVVVLLCVIVYLAKRDYMFKHGKHVSAKIVEVKVLSSDRWQIVCETEAGKHVTLPIAEYNHTRYPKGKQVNLRIYKDTYFLCND